jgi:hypothetical protein
LFYLWAKQTQTNMKKFLIIAAIFIGIFCVAALVLPTMLKPKVKAEIEKQLNQKLNADVSFADFDLTIIPNFPNVTASLNDFLIRNKAPFEGDTLMAMKDFAIEINIKSVLFGDEIKINGIYLNEPRINVKVLKNGQANYDIAKPQPEQAETDTAKTKFSADVDKWEIKNGQILYNDKLLNTNVLIENINHSGSGDFNQDEFDLELKTTIEKFTAIYENTTYLNKVQMQADMILGMDMLQNKYTFKDNIAKINDFAAGFEGYFMMPAGGGYEMDMTFAAKQTEFKNFISLIPAVFLKGYEDLETKGTMAFNGFVRGTYNEKTKRMPAYNLKLQVNDGYFKYPKLPTPVSEVLIDMEVDNKTGVTANTVVDIRKFAMKLGSNPINGRLKVLNLKNYPIDADLTAKVNLAEMTQVFPIDSMTLKGLFELNVKANGVYDTIQKTIPKINASMKLADGYVKSEKFPTMPMENMTVATTVVNTTGKKADTKIDITALSLLLQGKPFAMQGSFENLDDIVYDITIKGEMDLDKVTKIYPLEDKQVAGNLVADIKTKGKLSDAKAKKYDKLPTSGNMTLKNFTFTSLTVPQGVKITEALLTFTPQNIALEKYSGKLGKSDVEMTGQISNYVPYMLSGEVIKGNLTFNSNKFDCNEWLTEDKKKEETKPTYSVIELPKNVDFTFAAAINEVNYTNMKLQNAKGGVIMRGGILTLSNFQFNTLGGNFVANGTYNPTNVAAPKFDFDLNISNVAVSEAYKTFNTVQSLMPVAQNLTGNFSTGFNIKGLLGQDMMPVMTSLSGGGLIKLLDAALQNTALIDKLKSLLKLDNLSNQLKDINLQGRIENGRFYVPNTVFKLGGIASSIQGSNGLDGSMEYLLELNVPKGRLGAEISSKLDQYVGTSMAAKENVKLMINIGGTYKSPLFALAKGTAEDIKQEFKEKVEEKKQQAVDSVKKVGIETGKQIVADIFKKDSTAQPPQKRAEDAINRLKNGLFGGFGKKPEPEKPKTEEPKKSDEVQKDSTGGN